MSRGAVLRSCSPRMRTMASPGAGCLISMAGVGWPSAAGAVGVFAIADLRLLRIGAGAPTRRWASRPNLPVGAISSVSRQASTRRADARYRVDPAWSRRTWPGVLAFKEGQGRCSSAKRAARSRGPRSPLLLIHSDGRFTHRTSPAEAPGGSSANQACPHVWLPPGRAERRRQSVCLIVDRCLPLKPGWLHLARRINCSSGGNMVSRTSIRACSKQAMSSSHGCRSSSARW